MAAADTTSSSTEPSTVGADGCFFASESSFYRQETWSLSSLGAANEMVIGPTVKVRICCSRVRKSSSSCSSRSDGSVCWCSASAINDRERAKPEKA